MAVDKEIKQLKTDPIFLCKSSWYFSKKEEYDTILKNWQITFQALDYKGKNFLNLNNNDNLPTRPTYSKGGIWLKLIGHSNSLCVWTTRAITNYTPIGEYHLRFFPKESFACPCRDYPIKSRNHILHDCKRYMKYWNSNRKSLKNIITFLKVNPEAFFLYEGIT